MKGNWITHWQLDRETITTRGSTDSSWNGRVLKIIKNFAGGDLGSDTSGSECAQR